MIKIDEKDEKIIKALAEDSDISVKKLYQLIKIPMPTIYRRIKELKKEGIIKKTKAVIDYKTIGLPICALVFINLEEAPDTDIDGTIDELKSIPSVRELYKTFGQWDIILKLQTESLDELHKALGDLRRNPSIEEVNSMLLASEEIVF
jgi:DNA-binding Lrp family transcriptional regulator